MKITKDTYVACSYTLYRVGDTEEIVEQATAEAPLAFISGSGLMLEDFEANLEGLDEGDAFDFTLTPAQAYGEMSQEYIIQLEKNIFLNNEGKFDEEVVFVGNAVPMLDNDGNQLTGIVDEISDSHVTMNFNHPLAGQTLHFVGKILTAHPATDEERQMIAAAYAPQHGCGDGGCSCGDGGCSCGGGGCSC